VPGKWFPLVTDRGFEMVPQKRQESPARSTTSQTKCPMLKDLNSKDEVEIVREDPYNPPGRIKAVTRRIENSTAISKTNKQLIFQFCDQAALQGLSQARVLFYLNRFWNLARYVEKDFNRLTRKDIEELVRKVQNQTTSRRSCRGRKHITGGF